MPIDSTIQCQLSQFIQARHQSVSAQCNLPSSAHSYPAQLVRHIRDNEEDLLFHFRILESEVLKKFSIKPIYKTRKVWHTFSYIFLIHRLLKNYAINKQAAKKSLQKEHFVNARKELKFFFIRNSFCKWWQSWKKN